jgi:hypothetical protein
MLKTSLGMGHGDANTLVHTVLKSDGPGATQGLSADQVLDGLMHIQRDILRGPFHESRSLLLGSMGLGRSMVAARGAFNMR